MPIRRFYEARSPYRGSVARTRLLTYASLALSAAGLVLAVPELVDGAAAYRLGVLGALVVSLPALVLGTLLTRLQPANVVGPLLCVAGTVLWWDLGVTYAEAFETLAGAETGRRSRPGWRAPGC